jgi:hypothetical protein
VQALPLEILREFLPTSMGRNDPRRLDLQGRVIAAQPVDPPRPDFPQGGEICPR